MTPLILAVAFAAAGHAREAARIFASGDRAAAVYEREVEFFILPPDTVATISGRSAFGPLAEKGMLLFSPALKPAKVLTFSAPIAKPLTLERNGARFMICADYCGVFDVSGRVVYRAPAAKKGGSVDGLALSVDGGQALFEYRQGKEVQSYLVWAEKGGKPKTYKADMRDAELRRALNRFGLNDWDMGPQKDPKQEPRAP